MKLDKRFRVMLIVGCAIAAMFLLLVVPSMWSSFIGSLPPVADLHATVQAMQTEVKQLKDAAK